MFDRLTAGVEPEFRHTSDKFVKEHLHFCTREQCADAFVRTVAKRVMVKRSGATSEIDFHQVRVTPLVEHRLEIVAHAHLRRHPHLDPITRHVA